jgi:hypothetical protein
MDIEASIDDVMLFNRGLSTDEVRALYANTSSRYVERNFTGLSEGTHTYTAYAQDTAGNVNSSTRTFTRDNAPPTISVNVPSNNSRWNTSTISFNVTLNEAGSWCGFSLNMTANVTMGNTSTIHFNYTQTGLDDGEYNITFSCNDTVNYKVNSGYYYFSVDTVFPNISFVDPTLDDGDATGNDWIYVNVSVSDSASNISTFIDFDDSLVGWWRMDDVNQSGIGALVHDSSVYGNNGTAIGDATQTDAGYFGKGYSFDGSGDYIEIPKAMARNDQNQTFSLWVYPESNVDDGQMIRTSGVPSDRGFSIHYGAGGGVWYYFVFGTSVFTRPPYTLNNWVHILVTITDNSTHKNVTLYENGSYVTSGLSTLDYAGLDEKGRISNNFNGTIDDVMIFNRSLTLQEIQALYANQTSRYLERNFTDLSEGNHTFRAYTQDMAGNVNSTGMRTVTRDLTEPTITVIIPTNNTYLNSATPGFNITLSEAGSWCGFSLNMTANVTMENTTASRTSFNYTHAGLADGSYNITFSHGHHRLLLLHH